jgi:hypothetical protein
MYRLTMEQGAREDIAAAAAAHHELGRDYDGAVAESLIDRIGEEIDKRVDARLGALDRGPGRPIAAARPAAVVPPGQRRAYWSGIAVGAGVASVPAILVASHGSYNSKGLVLVEISIWIVIAVVYFIAGRVRITARDRD